MILINILFWLAVLYASFLFIVTIIFAIGAARVAYKESGLLASLGAAGAVILGSIINIAETAFCIVLFFLIGKWIS